MLMSGNKMREEVEKDCTSWTTNRKYQKGVFKRSVSLYLLYKIEEI